MTSDEIRSRFLGFFESKRHKIVPSDSLIPANDPSVLFTSAGMNQFKDQFMARNVTFTRAATCQKCLRTGDLENVGRTSRHHTFFEMLGNFSFGDYFKKEAIAWAWEFLTSELGLPSEKLWVSVYEDDDEAYDIWKDDIKVPARKIKRYGARDNFWPAEAPLNGPNGPCGPCSEIFYDRGAAAGCGAANCGPSCGCGRFVEVWNLVFTQFNRTGKNRLEPLKSKNIDTGMGLERLASVMQGAGNNFETDLFAPIIKKIAALAGGRGGDFRVKAIADHIRAVCFMASDGILPSNEERGYVERMLIRRAFRLGMELGAEEPFLYKIVPSVARIMKGPYPELDTMREGISDVVLSEEERFRNTLREGTAILNDMMEGLKKKNKKVISGDDAFWLYDTYGFPAELTLEMAKAAGFSMDKKGFDEAMERQRELARSRSKIKSSIFEDAGGDNVILKLSRTIKPTVFTGYERCEDRGTVLAVVVSGRRAKSAKAPDKAEVILDKTPFYGSSGGQIGDSGEILTDSAALKVTDTSKSGGVIVHACDVLKGQISEKDKVRAAVDKKSRLAVAASHTATHLLHYALRKVLGGHVKQSGSRVGKNKFRFDFTHFKPVGERQLKRIEEIVNELGSKDIKVKAELLKREDAKKKGAIALFGEKYGPEVRMVSVGDVSKELCGGTHLERTGEMGAFRIVSEGSVASGIRRIEAVIGEKALEHDRISREALKAKEKREEEKRIEKDREKQRIRESRLALDTDTLIKDAKKVLGARIISAVLKDMNARALGAAADDIRKKAGPSVIVALGSEAEEKAVLVCAVSADLTDKGISAGAIIKKISGIVGGSGGGRPDFAQAGGRDASKLKKALDEIPNTVREELKK